jgi:putative ABC transport system permease protein
MTIFFRPLSPPGAGAAQGFVPGLRLVLSLAWREQRNGLGGFYVFIACVALGVAVITGVGVLADALTAGFASQGRALLGGDVTLSRPHQALEGDQRAWLWQQGPVSEAATMRAMARTSAGEQALVEFKGVDDAYPLVGALGLSPAAARAAMREGGAAVDPILLERLGLAVGDSLALGRSSVPIVAVIAAEPDRLAERLAIGPRVLVSLDTMRRTGLIGPGSLVTWRYAVRLDDPSGTPAALAAFREQAMRAMPEAGFTVRDRSNPSPQLSRTLERLRQFLTLVGVTALLVGGVGIANAVATYIERRRKVIAAFKSLGATGGIVLGVHLVQIMMVAGIGIAIGIAAGLILPAAVRVLLGDSLPITTELSITPRSLMTAFAYGGLVSLLFTLWPLGRAEQVRPAAWLREEAAPTPQLPGWRIVLVTLAAAAGLAALAVLTAEARLLALYYCLGVVGAFALFALLAAGIAALARRAPRPRPVELALAIGNIGAPGALTRSVVLSLGAGLSLLVTVALVDHAILAELTGRMQQDSPSYFVLDLKPDEIGEFHAAVLGAAPLARVKEAPMLRGRLVALGGRPAEQIAAAPEAQWVLNGDRGLTYAEEVPEGSRIVAGSWWPAGYTGEPLVSFDAELARGLGVGIGDTVTVNVLGRNVIARIANLREVNWESLALNFVMVFSPNTLAAAPHGLLATVTLPPDIGLGAEARLGKTIAAAFPAATAIRVKDAIDAFAGVFGRVMVAVRTAGAVTLLSGAVVLAGGLATAQRRRIQQAVILKAVGATSRRILASHLLEYLLLAFCTSVIALLIGSLAAWMTLKRVIDVPFAFSLSSALGITLGAIVLVAALGAFGTWRVLKAPPLPYLRSE